MNLFCKYFNFALFQIFVFTNSVKEIFFEGMDEEILFSFFFFSSPLLNSHFLGNATGEKTKINILFVRNDFKG